MSSLGVFGSNELEVGDGDFDGASSLEGDRLGLLLGIGCSTVSVDSFVGDGVGGTNFDMGSNDGYDDGCVMFEEKKKS